MASSVLPVPALPTIERVVLLLVARPDAEDAVAQLLERGERVAGHAHVAEGRVVRVALGPEEQVLVRVVRVVLVLGERERALLEEQVDVGARHLELAGAAVELLDVDALREVVLRRQAERVGADAQVHVLGDEDRRHAPRAVADVERHGEDVVVGDLARAQGLGQLAARERDGDAAARGQAHAIVEVALLAQGVEQAGDGAGVATALVQLLLEGVDLLDDRDRDVDVVLLELEERLGIVQQDIRIEDEVLEHGTERRAGGG
jgi:hypothetical protein